MDPEDTSTDTEDTLKGDVTDEKNDVTDQEEELRKASIKAEVEAQVEAFKQELTREASAKEQAERDRREQEDKQTRLLNSFGTTVREVRDNLKKKEFWDDDGNRRTLTDAEIEELVVTPFARYNIIGEQASEVKFRKLLADAALEALPEETRKTFIEQASGKDIKEWLDHLTESRAANTAYAKKLIKEHEVAVAAAEERGYAKAKKGTPPPSKSDSTTTRQETNTDTSTLSGLLKSRHAGTISDDIFYKKAREFGLFY